MFERIIADMFLELLNSKITEFYTLAGSLCHFITLVPDAAKEVFVFQWVHSFIHSACYCAPVMC